MVQPPQVFTLTRAAPASRGASIEAPTPPAATNVAASKHASTRFIAMPVPPPRSHVNAIYIYNPSCPLQALNREGQQEPDDLQLEASRCDRVDLLGEQARQSAEDRLYVLANRLAQKLLPQRHRPLGVLLALGL